MRSTFSSTVRDAGCGFRRRPKTRCFCITPHGRASATSAPSGSRDGKLVYRRETARFNAETCFDFLWHLFKVSSRTGRKVVVITDNARYHHAALHKEWRKVAEPWFRLEYLPPYSPDLNPIERVWKLTRRLATHNRYFPEIEDVITAVEHTFESWRKGSDALRRLCAIT